ncbi:MAG: hypothetical protein WCI36_00140 [bacterium]
MKHVGRFSFFSKINWRRETTFLLGQQLATAALELLEIEHFSKSVPKGKVVEQTRCKNAQTYH